MSKRTNIEIVYDLLKASKEPLSFYELWKKIVSENGYTEEEANSRISKFYTALLVDGHIINLGDNKWDLRDRVKLELVLPISQVAQAEAEEEDAINEEEDEDEALFLEETSEEGTEERVKIIVNEDE